MVGSWHLAAGVVLPNSDQKLGFFRSGVAAKAAVRYREIPANIILELRVGKSPKETRDNQIIDASITGKPRSG